MQPKSALPNGLIKLELNSMLHFDHEFHHKWTVSIIPLFKTWVTSVECQTNTGRFPFIRRKKDGTQKNFARNVFPTEPKTNERFRIVSPQAHNWRYVKLNQSFNEISIRDNSIWWHVGWMAVLFQRTQR